MAKKLTVALPKGRLTTDALAYLERAGYGTEKGEAPDRSLVLDSPDSRLRLILTKPSDVPVFVEHGAADAGIAGLDVIREAGVDLYEPLLLPFGYCRMVVAGLPAWANRSLRLERSPRVATKFPRIAEEYFRRQGLSPEIIVVSGSVELAPLVHLADLIVDLVQTGTTLRDNGLTELQVVLQSQAALVVNRASYRLKAAPLRELIDALSKCVSSESPQISIPALADGG